MPTLNASRPSAWPSLFSRRSDRLNTGNLRQLLPLFLVIYLPVAAVVLLLLFAVDRVQSEQQMNAVQVREMGQVQVAAQILAHDIEGITSDLLVLTRAPSMATFVETNDEAQRAHIAELFRSVSNEKRIYDQIRYIDADGMERMRVNYSPNGAVIVPDKDLQSKGERYYFRDSYRLGRGEIYVSPLDLNIEHRQIELPFKPMLRLGTPVFDREGVKRGVIVLNVFGEKLLEDFRRAMGEHQHAMLLNRDGYWLSHPDSAKEWGFMFGRKESFATTYPLVWQQLLSRTAGTFLADAGLFSFTTVYPLHSRQYSSTGSPLVSGESIGELEAQEFFWKVVSLVPAKDLPIAGWRLYRKYLPGLLGGLLLLAVLVGFLTAALLSRRQWRQAVFENENRLREITATLGEGLYVLDKQGLVTFVNPEAERLLGWQEAELVGRNGHDTFHYLTPEGRRLPVEECPVHQTINTGKAYHSLNDWVIRKDGTLMPVTIVSAPLLRGGQVVGSVAAFQDISPRLEAERSLRESEARFRSALENAPIGMAIVSLDGRFTEVNQALCRILGYSRDELVELSFAAITHPDDLQADLANADRLLAGEIHSYQMEKRYLRKDGGTVWAQLTGSILRDTDTNPLYFLAQVEDISERKRQQEQIRQLAFYDTLTGLPNRRLFLDHFEQALTQARRYQRSLAVMFLDLDQFKQVNDTLGHDVGDELLEQVADRLTASVRHGDTVSRQGGDEFVIVLAEIAHPEDAARVAQKILDTLHTPFSIQGHVVKIGVSIGIAIYPVDGTDNIQELMKKADIAMYASKEAGRNCYHFFGT